MAQFDGDFLKTHSRLLPKRKPFSISSQDQSADKRVCTCPANNICLPGEYENVLAIQIGSGQAVHARLLTAAGQSWQTQRKQSRCAMIGIMRGVMRAALRKPPRSGGLRRSHGRGVVTEGDAGTLGRWERREHRNIGTAGVARSVIVSLLVCTGMCTRCTGHDWMRKSIYYTDILSTSSCDGC